MHAVPQRKHNVLGGIMEEDFGTLALKAAIKKIESLTITEYLELYESVCERVYIVRSQVPFQSERTDSVWNREDLAEIRMNFLLASGLHSYIQSHILNTTP
jgi:hypothetical protein